MSVKSRFAVLCGIVVLLGVSLCAENNLVGRLDELRGIVRGNPAAADPSVIREIRQLKLIEAESQRSAFADAAVGLKLFLSGKVQPAGDILSKYGKDNEVYTLLKRETGIDISDVVKICRNMSAKCEDCLGIGEVDCPECIGTGWKVCRECRGKGCQRCSGTGVISCEKCSGTGVIDCGCGSRGIDIKGYIGQGNADKVSRAIALCQYRSSGGPLIQ